jgi:CHAT domain-containing protein
MTWFLIAAAVVLQGFAPAKQPLSIESRPGFSIERELSGGESHEYRLVLDQDELFIRLVVEQRGIDVVIAVNADGRTVAEVDRPNTGYGRESISVRGARAAEYRILVRSLAKSAPAGVYRLAVAELRPAVPRDESRVTAEQAVSLGETLRAGNTAEDCLRAIEKFEHALTLWRALDDPYEELWTLYGLGLSHRFLGRQQNAIADFEAALNVASKLSDVHGQAMVLTARGWAYLYVNQLEKARTDFGDALPLRRALGDRAGEALSETGLGWANLVKSAYHLALQHFRAARDLRRQIRDRRGEALTSIGIGRVLVELGLRPDALTELNRAHSILAELGDRFGEAEALSQLGWAYTTAQEPDTAVAYFERALALRRVVGDRAGEGITLFGIARAEHLRGRSYDALARVETALDIVEGMRGESVNQQIRMSYFASVQEYYGFSIEVLMALHRRDPSAGYAARAFSIHQRARTRVLLDLLENSSAPRESAEERSDQGRPLTADEVRRELLDANSLLLEYAVGEHRSVLWALTADTLTTYELPRRIDLEAAVLEWREEATARSIRVPGETAATRQSRVLRADRRAAAAAEVLSRMLLAPVAGELGRRRLVVVPHGVLQLVPFAALPAPSRLGDRRQLPLIVEHEIVHLPSASAMVRLRRMTEQRTPAAKAVAVFADPVFSAGDERFSIGAQLPDVGTAPRGHPAANHFGRLPDHPAAPRLFATRWEADRITAMVPRGQALRLLDFAASRRAALNPDLRQYRVIHFATHAYADDVHPEAGGILLSSVGPDGQPMPGLLSVQDILGLRLGSDLVVLGGCRTALGQRIEGEGIVGLARGFFHAGVPRVVAGLWEAEDTATAQLMVRFYREMFGPSDPPVAAALRAAQIAMWKDPRWHAPYYWAGFVLQGEWR